MQAHGDVRSSVPSLLARNGPIVGFGLGFGRFIVNYLVMCFAMCAGGGFLARATLQGFIAMGYPNPIRQLPELTIVILAIEITLPMTAYMFIRRHPLRHNLEMSGASLAGGAVLLMAYWAGFVPPTTMTSTKIFGAVCFAVCGGMVIDMLIRFKHYSGIASHATHQGVGARLSHRVHTG